MPFLAERKISQDGLSDYFTFQYTIGTKNPFDSIQQLAPAHFIKLKPGVQPELHKYWEVHYEVDYSHTEKWFVNRLRELLDESGKLPPAL